MTAPTGFPSVRSGRLAVWPVPPPSGFGTCRDTCAAFLLARFCLDVRDRVVRLSSAFIPRSMPHEIKLPYKTRVFQGNQPYFLGAAPKIASAFRSAGQTVGIGTQCPLNSQVWATKTVDTRHGRSSIP